MEDPSAQGDLQCKTKREKRGGDVCDSKVRDSHHGNRKHGIKKA